ncbi:TPA: hypothetical protein ACH3X1_010127 [Trebouxia sp. C0004]
MISAPFEKEYLVTLNTCQSADWRACTTLIRKHAEQASHQVEDGLDAVLATDVCLSSTRAVAKTNSLKDDPGMGHQSINPCQWNCNCAVYVSGKHTLLLQLITNCSDICTGYSCFLVPYAGSHHCS